MDNLIMKKFNEFNVEIRGNINNPLFKANDIAKILGIQNIHQNSYLKDSDKTLLSIIYEGAGAKDTLFLTESGLYKTLMKSRKKISEEFQEWVCNILKQIRLTGKYELENKLKEKDNEINELKNSSYFSLN